MRNTIRESIMDANATEGILQIFVTQIGLSAIILGLCFRSWIVFGSTFLLPFLVVCLSNKHKLCKTLSIVLGVIYIPFWAFCGFIIGKFFSLSASIVLSIIFLVFSFLVNRFALEYIIQPDKESKGD